MVQTNFVPWKGIEEVEYEESVPLRVAFHERAHEIERDLLQGMKGSTMGVWVAYCDDASGPTIP